MILLGLRTAKKFGIIVHSTRFCILEACSMIQQIDNSVRFITHPTLLHTSLVSRCIYLTRMHFIYKRTSALLKYRRNLTGCNNMTDI
jgi:hypothetical protein